VLHGGLGVDHTLYRSLDELCVGWRLIYLDHRGNGRSDRPDPATLTMAGWADDALEVARAVAGEDPLIVFGHSYGGFVAQELAIRHPAHVRALVLVCTTPGQLGTGEAPAHPGPSIPVEFEALLSSPPECDADVAATMAALAPAYVRRVGPERFRELMAETVFSSSAMRRGFEVLSTWSSVDRLGSITAPTLVVAGRHDPFTSWPQADRIGAHVPGAEVIVFEESSHFPWLDEPEAFTAAIRQWLERVGIR
jgi:proline iminopeptidase